MAAGRLAAALVTIMKGTADRTASRLVPRFLLTSALGLAIRMTEGKPIPPGVIAPRDLIPAMHYDARTVLDAAGPLDRFARQPLRGQSRHPSGPPCVSASATSKPQPSGRNDSKPLSERFPRALIPGLSDYDQGMT
jgi:hypothetical protein